VSEQPPRQYQGQPQYPQQQPYGQQPYPQGRPPYGQQQDPYMQPTQGFYGQQPQPPHGPPGHRAQKSWPRRHRVLTVIGGIFGVFVLIGVIDAAAGGSHHSAGTLAAASSSSSSASTGVAPSYADVQSLIAAMAVHGAVCSDVSINTGSTVGGALSTYAECSGVSSGDTAIVVFTDHASALAYANNMLSTGEGLGDPTAEVVGPNWTVNTVPAFADKVVNAVGGQLMAEPSTASGASSAPQPSAPAAPTMTRQADKVVFKVWGSGYPSVQYGSDSDSNQAKGGYGPLGDGVALPWSASLSYDPSPLYYAVSARLQGYGTIRDSVTEVITTYCSDGSHKTESFPLAAGNASGGYAIAQAEYTGGNTGNATQAESDAGC